MCEALRELMKDEIEKELENKLEQGEKLQLIRQVIKKLQKGNSVEETADMLEEEPENIRKIYEIAATMVPDQRLSHNPFPVKLHQSAVLHRFLRILSKNGVPALPSGVCA